MTVCDSLWVSWSPASQRLTDVRKARGTPADDEAKIRQAIELLRKA